MEHQSMAQTKPMMTFPDAVKTCLRKYGDFSGRATRAEYWWWVLAVVIGSSIFTAVDSSITSFSGQDYAPFATIFSLALILPKLTVTARRLHDIGKSGWWQMVWYAAIPVAFITFMIGLILAIVLGASEGGSWEFLEGGLTWETDDIPFSAASVLALLLGVGIAFLIGLGVFIWSLIWLISQGQADTNHYGPDPRASDPTAQEELP